mmetsp:Transcript_16784/g.18791  ORF Transcript_16784/g.18791 Transcript_16784/m.18791 type:complete len:130 (-) Transcript_16784:267-656(-)
MIELICFQNVEIKISGLFLFHPFSFFDFKYSIHTVYDDRCLLHHFIYAELNLVTALVPSETACLASSPGSIKRTAVWISRLDRVAFLLYLPSFPASVAIRSKMSLMKEFMIDIPFLEIPVSGWTCLRTR